MASLSSTDSLDTLFLEYFKELLCKGPSFSQIFNGPK